MANKPGLDVEKDVKRLSGQEVGRTLCKAGRSRSTRQLRSKQRVDALPRELNKQARREDLEEEDEVDFGVAGAKAVAWRSGPRAD
jgi:hypothetical protein